LVSRAHQNGKAQFGRGKQNNTNFNKNNSNTRGLFPQLHSADQFSNNQDFTSDELAIDDTHAVPFDYSQMQKRKYAGDRNTRQQNANVYQGNRGGGGGGSRGSKSGKGRGKGKARHPGLGTSQQQKKAAQQTGSDDSSTQPREWQPSNPNQMRLIPMPSEADLHGSSSNNSNAGARGGRSEASQAHTHPLTFSKISRFRKESRIIKEQLQNKLRNVITISVSFLYNFVLLPLHPLHIVPLRVHNPRRSRISCHIVHQYKSYHVSFVVCQRMCMPCHEN